MTRISAILLLLFFTYFGCSGQTGNSKKPRNAYSNWMSIDYMNCLKTGLPCECEKTKEYFLISIDTASKFVLLYDGRANYDYNLYGFKTISKSNLEVYEEHYSPALFKDTMAVIGKIAIKNDSLLFAEPSGKQTKFVFYNAGDNHSYFKEHIKLINSALAARGYGSLNTTLQSDSLKCWCNWELDGGINLVFGKEKNNWILEKKNNELYIYQWTNPPVDKTEELKIEKKLIKKLKW